MKKSLSFLVIAVMLITVSQSLTAQDGSVASKHFFTEFGGPGIIMSANFDARFISASRLGFGYRLGAGFGVGKFADKKSNTSEKFTRTVYSFPVGLNYIFGKPDMASSFEVGGGISVLSRKMSLYYLEVEKEGNMIGYLTFMYRVTPVNGGMSFRIGFTPIIGTAGDLFPMGAVGFGYAF